MPAHLPLSPLSGIPAQQTKDPGATQASPADTLTSPQFVGTSPPGAGPPPSFPGKIHIAWISAPARCSSPSTDTMSGPPAGGHMQPQPRPVLQASVGCPQFPMLPATWQGCSCTNLQLPPHRTFTSCWSSSGRGPESFHLEPLSQAPLLTSRLQARTRLGGNGNAHRSSDNEMMGNQVGSWHCRPGQDAFTLLPPL